MDLTWLPKGTIVRIERAVEAIERALGDDLVAVALVGAAVDKLRVDRAQFPELLVVAARVTTEELRRLA